MLNNLQRLVGIFLVVIVGTFLDFLVHLMSERFSVPEYYFSNKLLYATLWLMIGLIIFWRIRTPFSKAVWMTALFAIVIQTRYFLEGYPLWFVFFFMAIHFITFLAPLYGLLRLRPQLFNVQT